MCLKKLVITLVLSFILLTTSTILAFKNTNSNDKNTADNSNIQPTEDKNIKIPNEYSKEDKNNNGIPDPIDISNNVKVQLDKKIKYIDSYYQGGYPPDDEGVCTDVIWRAFNSIDINLKELIDKDISTNIHDYPRITGSPDPNIDFRRVPNQKSFFDKYAETLTSEIIPGDVENLKQWQPGDIILYLKPYEHVGIVTDERDADGIPWVIHNARPQMTEGKLTWFEDYELIHYRWKY